jgi:hypothetical protein
MINLIDSLWVRKDQEVDGERDTLASVQLSMAFVVVGEPVGGCQW